MANIDRVFLRFDGGKGQVCISRGTAEEMRSILCDAVNMLQSIHASNATEVASELSNMVEQLDDAEERWQRREELSEKGVSFQR